MSVGAALIGATGFWGPRIAAAVERGSELRLVTCWSRDAERLRAFAEERGLVAAASFEAAVEHPDVQAVLLVTPNDVHREQALACADRGRHVFVEKPIADSVEAGIEMRDRFVETALVLSVGHGMRRLGAARRVRELLDLFALGTVVLAEANWSLPSRLTPEAWRWYRDRAPGGPLLQLGVHHVDTLRYWLGPIARSSGSFAHLATEAESDDVGAVMLEFEQGPIGVVTGSYVSPRTYFLRLYGTQANLVYEVDMSVWPNAHQADAATRLVLQTGDETTPIAFDRRDPLVEELDELGRCIRGEAVPETGAEEGIAALRPILEALT